MQTDWIAGNSGNWTDSANWTNGVPGSGDTATIADGRPLMVDQNIHNEQIDITPVGGSQRVTLTLNGNDSFGTRTVLNIDTGNATGQAPVTLFFGNMREGGRSGGTFNNHGTINVTGPGYPDAGAVHFDLSGGYTSFLFTNSGDMNVTNADLSFAWPSAGSGDRPFVTNTGDIVVHATAAAYSASFSAVGDPSYAPAAVRLMNDGTILIQGSTYGTADDTTGYFNVVQGTGTISLLDGTASFAGNVGTGETLNFLDDPVKHVGDNVLNLNGAKASFNATITGFGKGDTINLGTHASSVSYDSGTGVLTLSDGGQARTLHFAGLYQTDNFKLVQNGDGTTSLEYRPAVPPNTTIWLGGSGNIADAANWSHGVPQPGWTAVFYDGEPTMTNAAIQGVTIDVGPYDGTPASVAFTVNGASSFDGKTTLNILSSPTLVGTTASVFFGNMRGSGISGGSFVNSGTINVNPGGYASGAVLDFNLSGGYTPFQLTNAGAINITDATLSIQWVTAGSGLRPFVVNTGSIDVQSNGSALALLRAVGGTNQPSDVVGVQNDGKIAVQGYQGTSNLAEADFNQVNGTGSISVDNGTVSFVGNVSAGETLQFISDPNTGVGDNVLKLNMGKATFGATIQGFGQGDRIDLGVKLSQSHLFYDPQTGVLTADGGTIKLHFAGSYTASDFQVASNPDGTSAIVANPSATIPLSDLIPAGSANDAAPLPQAMAAGGAAGGAGGQIGAGGSASLADVLAALHSSAAQGVLHVGGVS